MLVHACTCRVGPAPRTRTPWVGGRWMSSQRHAVTTALFSLTTPDDRVHGSSASPLPTAIASPSAHRKPRHMAHSGTAKAQLQSISDRVTDVEKIETMMPATNSAVKKKP